MKSLGYNMVLVTGGSGFVGSRLKNKKPEWVYLSSKDCDLTDSREVRNLFGDLKPDAIIHLKHTEASRFLLGQHTNRF